MSDQAQELAELREHNEALQIQLKELRKHGRIIEIMHQSRIEQVHKWKDQVKVEGLVHVVVQATC